MYLDAEKNALDLTKNFEKEFIITKIKADNLAESFEYERKKRSKFQYDMNESAKEKEANTSFQRAKEFLFEIEKLLNNNDIPYKR